MPLLDLDRSAISHARSALARSRDQQREARSKLQAAQEDVARLQREGADARILAQAQRRVEALASDTRAHLVSAQEQLQAIRGLSDQLLRQRDASLMVQALDARHPVLLLPVSIQTRYDDATTRLMIRIYPDVVHAWQHDPGLTPSEREAGRRYWTQRFAGPSDSGSPWKEIAVLFGPMRSAYVVRALTPTNVDRLGADEAPQFDDARVPAAALSAREAVAAALPDRFVAVGWRNGVEVLRKWGRAVADLLPMSPLFDPLLAQNAEDWNPFDEDRGWLVDYEAAVAAGMAITVTEPDLADGTRLGDGLDRLVVLGVDWTQTPESAAELVADLLHNHQHAQGLAFVAQGTPTNNTAEARAGFAGDASDIVARIDPTVADAQAEDIAQSQAQDPGGVPVVPDELAGAGARLQSLLGLPAGGRFDAAALPGAALQEGAGAGHMINALWNATLGYTLRYFWNPLDAAQSLLDDAAIETLRAHAVRYVRPSGPLSALRIGNQPYGILPVVARSYQAMPNSALERTLLEAIGWFRGFWEAAVQRVPTLRAPSAEQMHQVLSMQPWSVAKRFWQVAGPAAIANYPDIEDLAAAQRTLIQFMVADLLDRWPSKSPFIAACAVRPKPWSLDAVAWVQRDPDDARRELSPASRLARDFLAALVALLSAPNADPRAALLQMQNAESLLEALLAFAADEEVLHSARQLFYGHLDKSTALSDAVKLAARNMRYAEYTGVDDATLIGDQFQLGHASAMLDVQLVGTTADQSVAQFIGSRLGEQPASWPEQLRNIASFRESLEFLQRRTVGELDLALRTTLDIASHRLDAWITSLATKRLDGMRDRSPGGLHLGAFGIGEDLRPDSRLADQRMADSMGYVHAPSLQQATTAAILRSGHLANRPTAGDAFDIDLRSHRVKRARRLLEGVANGQSMAALLGYRFERALRDHDLSQHILDYRLQFPMRPSGPGPESGEAIGARDVIDGLRLMSEYREKGIDAVSPVSVPPADRAKVAEWIDDLLDLMDSVSDLLVAESVHQLVGGNLDGAAAAMSTLDKQTRPPEPRVVETPHSTRGYTQRVVVVMQGIDAGAWSQWEDLAARVEPRLNAWLARLLGEPERYRFHARVLERIDTGEKYDGRAVFRWDDLHHPLQATVDELGMSPLSVVLGSEPQQHGGQSLVQERLSAVLSAKARAEFGEAAERMAIIVDADVPEGAPAGSLGMVQLESMAWLLRRLLDKTRALRRMDMVQARDGVETRATFDDGELAGVDLPELQSRLTIAESAAASVLAALHAAAAAAPEDPFLLDAAAPETEVLLAALQAALAAAENLGWRSAVARQPVAMVDAPGDRVNPADTVAAAQGRARALYAEITARLSAAPAADGTERFGEQVRKCLDRIRAILGKSFPILPVFTLGGFAAEAAASLAARNSLLDGDELAISGWLPKLACVRETTGMLCDAITAAEALGMPSEGGDFKLLQSCAAGLSPVKRWGALPPDPGDDLRGVVAIVAHAPQALETLGAEPGLAGLYVDEWTEAIPARKETTGISFHFDTPGARAPQSMLLAVPSDPEAQNWTLDELLGVVDEAMALARLRAVRPQDVEGLGLLLPGLFLSNNFRRDVPSVDFAKLLETNLASIRVAYGENTARSFMQMAAGKTVVSE